MKKRFFYGILVLSFLLILLSTQAMAKQMTILVFPFENTGDKQYSWISAGMTDTAINDLTGIKEVSVISNADRRKIIEETKFILSGLVAEETMIKVGKLVGANIIFSGSYLVSGKNVRVIARLINVETGKTEGSAKLDGTLEKIFDLQDKVVLTLLLETGKASITDVARVRIAEKTKPKTTAYELYAKGLELQDTNPKEALAYFTKALAIDENYVSALMNAGSTAGVALNLFAEALDYLTHADKIMQSRKATNTSDYARLMMKIGNLYHTKGDLDRALKYYIDSQAIQDRLGLQNTADYAKLMNSIGITYSTKGDLDRALQYYTDSQTIWDRLGLQNTADYANLMGNIGNVYNAKGDMDRALKYYLDAQEIMDRLGLRNTTHYASLMMNIGVVYNSKGDLDSALKYYTDFKEIHERLGLQNTAGYARLLFNMGLIYVKQRNKAMAGRYFRNAYDTFISAGYVGPEKDKALSNAQRLGY